MQYPAPKTRFSRERLDCSGPVSETPFPSQEPLPGRVKLDRREVKKEKNVEKVLIPPRHPGVWVGSPQEKSFGRGGSNRITGVRDCRANGAPVLAPGGGVITCSTDRRADPARLGMA